RSLLLWFPEFDSVSFRVHDPAEFAVVVTFNTRIDVDAFAFQRGKQVFEILDLKIDHECFLARCEIISACRKRRPDSESLGLGIVQFAPVDHCAAIFVGCDAKMLAIPLAKFVSVVRLEENPADASDAFHTTRTSP